jgi:hypothetical protein
MSAPVAMNTNIFREIVRFGSASYHVQLSIWSGNTTLAWVRYAPGQMTSPNDHLGFPNASFSHPGTGDAWIVTRLRIEVTRDTPAANAPGNPYVAFATNNGRVLTDIPVVRSVGTDQRLDFNSIRVQHGMNGLGQVINTGGTSTEKRWIYAARTTGTPGAQMGTVFKWGNNGTNNASASHIQFNGTPENDNVMRNSTLITFDNNTGSTFPAGAIDVCIHVSGTTIDTATLNGTRVGYAVINPVRQVPDQATLNVNSMTFTINPGPVYITADLSRYSGDLATFTAPNPAYIEFLSGNDVLAGSEITLITFIPDPSIPSRLINNALIDQQAIPVLTAGTITEIRVTASDGGTTGVARAINLEIPVTTPQVIQLPAAALRIS